MFCYLLDNLKIYGCRVNSKLCLEYIVYLLNILCLIYQLTCPKLDQDIGQPAEERIFLLQTVEKLCALKLISKFIGNLKISIKI